MHTYNYVKRSYPRIRLMMIDDHKEYYYLAQLPAGNGSGAVGSAYLGLFVLFGWSASCLIILIFPGLALGLQKRKFSERERMNVFICLFFTC